MATPTDTRNSSGPSLTSIPLEVLLQITSNLTTPEYGNLRRTCKHIEETLFSSFAREFFTKRQFMLTEFSLQALVNISKSRLSSSMKHVIFGLERPAMRQSLLGQTTEYIKENRARLEYLGHMSLLYANRDVEMLIETFSNLSNLATVGIRDFYSHSRNRDYPLTAWKSYGASTYELETGLRLDSPRRLSGMFLDQAEYCSRMFFILFYSLGKAGSRPKDFEVILRHSSLYDHAFNLPKYTDAIVQPVLDNLRILLLDLSAKSAPFYINMHDVPTACPNYLLRTFLSRLPALEHLRLNFRFYEGDEMSNLLSWLSQPIPAGPSNTTTATLLPDSPSPIEFAKLSRLDIGMVTVEPEILIDIIEKHRATLRTLNLHKLLLLQKDPTKSSRGNLWANFLAQISKLDLKLTGLKMSELSQKSQRNKKIRFITFKDSRTGFGSVREWGGTNVQSCLKDFMANLVVEGVDKDAESTQNASSDEEFTDELMYDLEDESDVDDDH